MVCRHGRQSRSCERRLRRRRARSRGKPARPRRPRDRRIEPDTDWENLLGTSPPAGELRRAILNAARAPFPVLVLGESGSGKELVARAIHRLGPRRHRRLCTINCAAISDDLSKRSSSATPAARSRAPSAERAGSVRGSRRRHAVPRRSGGADRRARRPSCCACCRTARCAASARTCRAASTRGSSRRPTAASKQEVDGGRFRADLRFRLDVIRIAVPPLRERATDIPALVAHFWEDAAARVGIAGDARAGDRRRADPLRLAGQRPRAPERRRLARGPRSAARADHARHPAAAGGALRLDRAERHSRRRGQAFERRYVRAALARAGGQRSRAARALGVSRQGLAKMLRRLGIDAADGRAP